MTTFIDKKQGFDVRSGLRTDKVAAHFTEDGIYRVSQDGQTVQTIPINDVVYLYDYIAPFSYTILPKQSGTTFVTDVASASIDFYLPKASMGKMVFSFLTLLTTMPAPHKLIPTSTDQIRGKGFFLANGAALTFSDTGAMVPASELTIMSEGTIVWFVARTGGTVPL